jgi:hypothetical protein
MASPADTLPRAAAIEPSATGSIDLGVNTGTHLVIEITAYYTSNVATGTHGTPLVRWGNATAPAGTTLLYAGLAFGSHYAHSGGRETFCLAAGDAGPASMAPSDLFYPSTTANGSTPPGITGQRLIRCAVFLPSRPAFVMWGSWIGPSGWTELYRGYMMSAHYTHSGGSGRRCVDSVNFDASLTDTATNDLWYGNAIPVAPAGQPYTLNTFVKCSVWMMPP